MSSKREKLYCVELNSSDYCFFEASSQELAEKYALEEFGPQAKTPYEWDWEVHGPRLVRVMLPQLLPVLH